MTKVIIFPFLSFFYITHQPKKVEILKIIIFDVMLSSTDLHSNFCELSISSILMKLPDAETGPCWLHLVLQRTNFEKILHISKDFFTIHPFLTSASNECSLFAFWMEWLKVSLILASIQWVKLIQKCMYCSSMSHTNLVKCQKKSEWLLTWESKTNTGDSNDAN